jgi:hypothetical protein
MKKNEITPPHFDVNGKWTWDEREFNYKPGTGGDSGMARFNLIGGSIIAIGVLLMLNATFGWIEALI